MKTPIEFVDITQRDGEQMKIEAVTIEDRIEIFDALIDTGITTFEIGHLGNSGRDGIDEGDQAYARALIGHIHNKSTDDQRYQDVKLQVLFGSQQQLMAEGLEAMEGFDKDRVVIHVYDRISPNLRPLASNPYTIDQAAVRVVKAALLAFDMGFRHFSISGEGATDCTVDEAIDYYSTIGQQLMANGSQSININLANTFGTPSEIEWDKEGLDWFDKQIKQKIPGATTSVHVHNDDRSATEFTIAAIKAGFNKVEGTLIGMGERSGNVALSDVLIRLLEIARLEVEATDRPAIIRQIGKMAARQSIFQSRTIPSTIIAHAHNWYPSSVKLGEIYGQNAVKRFESTSLGDPEAYNAGSGPHDHATLKAIEDPLQFPLWKNYLRIALPHAMLGRPEATGIIAAEPSAILSITVNGRAGAGSTKALVEGNFSQINESTSEAAIKAAREAIDTIYEHAA